MSVKEKLKKSKKAIVMGVLSLAAVLAPIKGQAKEASSTTNDTITAVALDEEAKKKMFEDAVRRGAPKEEIAKYVDFPEFIPVTKDGQLDKEKTEKIGREFARYIGIIERKGISASPFNVAVHGAFDALKEATDRKDLSPSDFLEMYKVGEKAYFEHSNKKFFLLFTAPLLLIAGISATVVSLDLLGVLIKNKGDLKKVDRELMDRNPYLDDPCFSEILVTTLLPLAAATAFLTPKVINEWKSTPEREATKIYADMYDTYVDQSIRTQQKQFKILDMNQAKQLIQNTQGIKQ